MAYCFCFGPIVELASIEPKNRKTMSEWEWQLNFKSCDTTQQSKFRFFFHLLHDFPRRPYCQQQQRGSFQDPVVRLGLRTRLASYLMIWMNLGLKRRKLKRSNPLHGRKQRPRTGIFLDLPYPKSGEKKKHHLMKSTIRPQRILIKTYFVYFFVTCIVTNLSSTMTSFVRKSAPIVALYWLENFLLTYWFMRDVFPTPESPRIMTFRRTFFRVAILRGVGKKWVELSVLVLSLPALSNKNTGILSKSSKSNNLLTWCWCCCLF